MIYTYFYIILLYLLLKTVSNFEKINNFENILLFRIIYIFKKLIILFYLLYSRLLYILMILRLLETV